MSRREGAVTVGLYAAIQQDRLTKEREGGKKYMLYDACEEGET